MSIKNLTPPVFLPRINEDSIEEKPLTKTYKLTGERLVHNAADDQEHWEPFTAIVTIDWERLAEFYCTGGRRKLGHSAVIIDSQIHKPKEVHLD